MSYLIKLILFFTLFAASIFAQTNTSSKNLILCDQSTFTAVVGASSTQLVALTAGKSVYVCAFLINGGGTNTAKFQSATASSCGGTLTALTPAFAYTTNTSVNLTNSNNFLFQTATGTSLCITTSAVSTTSNVFISYTII